MAKARKTPIKPVSTGVQKKVYKKKRGRRVFPVDESAPDDCIVVYTDGSCQGQGGTEANENRRAGVGVYFGAGHVHNLAEPFTVGEPTNNRAELWAIRRALDIIASQTAAFHPKTNVRIYTDSEYSLGALGKWRDIWKRTNFRNGKIRNRDIIEPIWTLLDEFIFPVDMRWTKGHAGGKGNDAADLLANKGAEMVNQSSRP